MATTEFRFQQPLWRATYGEPLRVEYADNPLILALPAYTTAQALSYLQVCPDYDALMRQGMAAERLECLLAAANFFQPLTHHLDMEQRFARMLRRSYMGRNPLDHGYWAETRAGIQAMAGFVPGNAHQETRTQGFTLLGISGIGKSRALERILALYPQVILHDTFGGRRFTWVQLVWVKLDCPQDGSLKGLCHAFFEEVDAILGTNYYATYARHGNATVDQMVISMARVAKIHSIGTLIIDEVQNLRQGAGNMAEKVLNFFVQVDNTIGVPLILVGTPKALDVLAGEFRRARRAVGQGDLIWNRMPENDPDWGLLMETLWRYQFVATPCVLTPELRHRVYAESQGIPDVAIKLYLLTQMQVIFQGKEEITAQRLRQTARQDLQLIQPFITALRTNDPRALLIYEDIRPIDLRVVGQTQAGVGTATASSSTCSGAAQASLHESAGELDDTLSVHDPRTPKHSLSTGYANYVAAGLTRPTAVPAPDTMGRAQADGEETTPPMSQSDGQALEMEASDDSFCQSPS